MLDYEKQIFLDILQDDGLVVAAKGLGLDSVIVNLLKVYCDPGNLVFVLGAEDHYREWLVGRLISAGATPHPRIVSAELVASEREKSYLKGGLWFVSTRILIVDLIKKRVPIDLITGVVVCKAHNILKNHQDSFILRLYRQGNKTGFVKAFSNQAAFFKGGITKVEQILKALFVRNLFLWPRYHAFVKSTLNECKPVVVELHLEMTSKMLQLQSSLLDLIKNTVQELKRLNPMLDTEEVTVENAISSSFHELLHSQLDPVWYTLSGKTKALMADLKLFHHLTMALLTFDSISFLSLVNTQRKTECALRSSGWHLMPSAEILFTVARQRVFGSDNINVTDKNEIDAEPNPKWLALSQVLNEIHTKIITKNKYDSAEMKKKCESSCTSKANELNNLNTGTENSDSEIILLLVRDEKTCTQLRGYLTLGAKEFLKSQYVKYFLYKKLGTSTLKESDLCTKLEQAGREDKGANVEVEKLERDVDICKMSLSKDMLSQLESNSEVNLAGYFEESFNEPSQKGRPLFGIEKFLEPQERVQDMPEVEDQTTPVIVIQSYKKNVMHFSQTLDELKPKWVIIYDSDMTLVRHLEVYQRKNPSVLLTVYFLVYGGTIEEQAYLTSLRKEKEAFDYLIQEKARMVIPEDRSDCSELTRDVSKASDITSRTRKGGLEPLAKSVPKVIVDMREFRSELPGLIHSRGIDIEPVTIAVGDYILSPDICIERKSISDLVRSLNCGRLYKQASKMTRYYSRPMLLIEFDKDRPFNFYDRYYLNTEASFYLLRKKLQLLTLHFPKLRIIWSVSPHDTAELFEELKQGRPEPDAVVAAKVGVELVANDEDTFNPAVQNFLSKLPGVTSKNIYSILHKGKSLDYLKKLSKNEISDMIQNSVDGENIYNAFHERYKPDVGKKNSKLVQALSGKRKRFHYFNKHKS